MQLWMREHNRLCGVIAQHPKLSKFDGNTQFEIAKSIVVAKMQQITVNGFLPALGITKDDLTNSAKTFSFFGPPKSRGFKKKKWTWLDTSNDDYSDDVGVNSPLGDRVSVEFSIAYRLGHTMIPDSLGDIDVATLFDGQVRLHTLWCARKICPARLLLLLLVP
jgi:hypothetical protein